MDLQIVNPADIPDWDGVLSRSGDHEFFHTAAWAKVLERTYGFKPAYHVSFENGLASLLVPLMEVRSRLTGRRGVSLPFTDHCPPFCLRPEIPADLFDRLISYGERKRWRYIEWRDGRYFEDIVQPSETFYVHSIDLSKPEQSMFSSLSENNRRNIRKGQKEGVSIRCDRSFEAMREFYRLNLVTRQRHGLPPQPFSFFRNVHDYVVSRDGGLIVLASYRERVVAASVFFHSGTKALYKYGASDLRYQSVRPNNFVMWEALKWYRDRGFQTMSLGRTELTNTGLLQFKRTWGGQEEIVKYFRYDLRGKAFLTKGNGLGSSFERVFSRMPTPLLRLFGSLLYKHVG